MVLARSLRKPLRMLRESKRPYHNQGLGVNIPDILQWPVAQNLGYRIVTALDGYPEVIEEIAARKLKITGSLPLQTQDFATKTKARCTFHVCWRWITEIPVVTCNEGWLIRKPPDWHVGYDGRLCFEFGERWTQDLTSIADELTLGLTADYACAWLLNSVRSLLQRHLFASREKIVDWPAAWDGWAHGECAARKQLMKLRKGRIGQTI
jgi:hypothetical protein